MLKNCNFRNLIFSSFAFISLFISGCINYRTNFHEEYNSCNNSKDCDELARKIENSAQLGNAEAQFQLGFLYHFGQHYKKDIRSAIYWYEKSARKMPESLFSLGYLYETEPEFKNYSMSVYWYMSAISYGYWPAEINLGNMFRDGIGLEKNYKKSMELYLMASKNNSSQAKATAYVSIGDLYKEGSGVPRDNVIAMDYYEKALRLHDEEGKKAAMSSMADLYVNGKGDEKNIEKGLSLYRESAELGYIPSNYKLGIIYEEGLIVPVNIPLALEYYKIAASAGNDDAKKKIMFLEHKSNRE